MQALKWVQAASSEKIQDRLARFAQTTRKIQDDGPQFLDASIPWETRRKLAIRMSQLNQDHVAHTLEVLEHLQPDSLPAPTGTDLMIDIDKLTLESINKLQVRVNPVAFSPVYTRQSVQFHLHLTAFARLCGPHRIVADICCAAIGQDSCSQGPLAAFEWSA